MKLLLAYILILLSFGQPANASNYCRLQVDDSHMIEITQQMVAASELALDSYTKLRTSSLSHEGLKENITSLKAKLKFFKAEIEENAEQLLAQEAITLVQLYYQILKNASAAELLTNSKGTDLFGLDYNLVFPIETYYNFAFDVDLIEGVIAYIGTEKVSFSLNKDNKYFAELLATAKPYRHQSEMGVYYRTLKCVLNRMELEKKIGLSELTGEPLVLPFSLDTRACHRLKFRSIVPQTRSFFYRSRVEGVQNLSKRTRHYLSEDDVQKKLELQAETPFSMADMYSMSIDRESAEYYAQLVKEKADPSLNVASVLKAVDDFDKLMTEAENNLIKEHPFIEKLALAIAKAATTSYDKTLACQYEDGLQPHFEELTTRVLKRYALSELGIYIEKHGVLHFANPERYKKQLEKVIQYAGLRVAEHGAEFLVLWELLFKQDLKRLKLAMRDINVAEVKNELNKLQGYQSKLNLAANNGNKRKNRVKLKDMPELQNLANETLQIMLKKNGPDKLEFDSAVMAKLFSGNITALPSQFKYYIEQILTRNSWENQKILWKRYKQKMAADVSSGKYKCEKTGWGRSAWEFAKGIGSEATYNYYKNETPETAVNGDACAFLHRMAQHLGLDDENGKERKSAPSKLSDVWPSFEKHYSSVFASIQKVIGETDNQKFLNTYRNYLKVKKIYAYPVLDTKLSSLSLKGQYPENWRVYSYLGRSKYTEASKNAVLEKAFKYTNKQIDNVLVSVSRAKKLSDLNDFVELGKGVNSALGADAILNYIPGEVDPDSRFDSETRAKKSFAAVYQTHLNYQDKLIQNNHIKYRIIEESIGRTFVPMYWLGGAALVRSIGTRTTGKLAAGNSFYVISGAMQPIIRGYFTTMNYIFAAGAYSLHGYEKAIDKELETIEELKSSDYIIYDGGPAPLLSFEDYMVQDISAKNTRGQVRFQKYLFGGLVALSVLPGTYQLVQNYKASRANQALRKPVKITPRALRSKRAKARDYIYEGHVGRAAKHDLAKIKRPLRQLGKPRYLSVDALRSARNASTHKNAALAYERVIFRLGQRASRYAGKPELEKILAQKWFGSKDAVSKVRELAREYNSKFPELVVGAGR